MTPNAAIETSRFITIPYLSKGRTREGADCWGGVRIIYWETYGIELPSYDDLYDASDSVAVQGVLERNKSDWIAVSEPRPGDVIELLTLRSRPDHVGVYLGFGKMLNCRKGAGMCVERIDTMFWRQRIVGYYRHCSRI